MRQTLRIAAIAIVLVALAWAALPWVWRHAFPAPPDPVVTPVTAQGVAASIDGVNEVVALGLDRLGVTADRIIASHEERRERDGLGWTYTRTTVDLERAVNDDAVQAAFDRWPDGADAFVTSPDELTFSLRVYVGKLPVQRMLLRLPLDPDPAVDPDSPPRLAVVVKGVGQRSAEVDRSLEIDAPLTLGVLPYRSHSLLYADDAARASKEVIAHLPLDAHPDGEATGGMAVPAPLGLDLSITDFRRRMTEDIEAVPFASGVLCSSATPSARDGDRMRVLGEVLSSGRLFLRDDALFPEGVALQEARRAGVPSSSVTAALGQSAGDTEVERALLRLRNLAIARGEAILSIQLDRGGARRLQSFIDEREREGYRLVFVSEIVEEP